MASVASPYGMVGLRRLGSAYNTQGFSAYKIASGYDTVIRFGDVVENIADGTIEKDVGTTTLTPLGVFLGCEYTADPDGLNYRLWSQSYPANVVDDNIVAYVLDDPDALFEIQADGTVDQTAVGANAAIVQTVTTNQFGKSRNALDQSSIATTDTLPLRIVGFVTRPSSEIGDAFTDLIVKFNNHNLRTQTGI